VVTIRLDIAADDDGFPRGWSTGAALRYRPGPMTAETDFWACRVCRSINTARAERCYSCHTPREAAAVKPTEMPTIGAAPRLEITATVSSTETFAVAASLATAIFIIGGLISAWTMYSVGTLRAERHVQEAYALLADRTILLAVTPVLGAVALVAYALWISRVVANLPGLGVGWSRVSPRMALLEPLIPGFNLYALPARVGEVIRKLDEQSPALPLLALGWGLVVIPPIAAGIMVRFSLLVQDTGDFFQTAGFLILLAFTIEAVGLGIGLWIVWQVERLQRTRVEAGPLAS
jgi:hypothetical protein